MTHLINNILGEVLPKHSRNFEMGDWLVVRVEGTHPNESYSANTLADFKTAYREMLEEAERLGHTCGMAGCIGGHCQWNFAATEQEQGMCTNAFFVRWCLDQQDRSYLALDWRNQSNICNAITINCKFYGRDDLEDVSLEDVRSTLELLRDDEDWTSKVLMYHNNITMCTGEDSISFSEYFKSHYENDSNEQEKNRKKEKGSK